MGSLMNPEDIERKTQTRIDIVAWLGESWQIYKKFWRPFTLTAIIFMAIFLVAQLVPYIGNLIVTGPMMIGFYLVIMDVVSHRKYRPRRLLQGFAWFVPAFLANFLITVFSLIGLIFLIIPGLVIGGCYMLTFIFMVDKNMGFWTAMEASRKVAFRDMVGMTLFYVCLSFINLLGFLFFFVGLLVTIPITLIATFTAYGKLVGFDYPQRLDT